MDRLDYKNYKMTVKEKRDFYLIINIAGIILSILVYDSLIFYIPLILAFLFLEKFYKEKIIRKHKEKLLIEFKDFLYLISTSFSLGRTMEQAMREALKSILEIYGSKSIMGNEIERILYSIEEANREDVELLKDFACRSDIRDIEDFVEVYANGKESGGDLIGGLNRASKIITDKISIEEEMKTSVSQRKTEGRIIALMPFVIIFFLRATSPSYIGVMYDTFSGRIIMTLALVTTGIAVGIIEKITSVDAIE